MTLQELKSKLDQLSPVKVQFVAKVIEALSNPPQVSIKKGTWITRSADWIEYFGLALLLHHGTTTEPLDRTMFETVFRNACTSMNWKVDEPGSPTRRFVDLEVQAGNEPKRRFSLKSTSAKNLSETRVHISKLTEAAWIQDLRRAQERRNQTLSLFNDYTNAVDAIVMLRAFREGNNIPHRYQLIEIPTAIFEPVQEAPVEIFRNDAPVIVCNMRGNTVARVAIDRSDAKITIRSILLSACVVHAEWLT